MDGVSNEEGDERRASKRRQRESSQDGVSNGEWGERRARKQEKTPGYQRQSNINHALVVSVANSSAE